MRKIILALAFAALLSGCKTTSQPPLKIGSSLSDLFVYGGQNIPLPPGDWTIASEQQSTNSGGAVIGNVMLVNIVNGELKRSIWIQTNLSLNTTGRGWMYDTNCERKNVFYISKTINVEGGEQKCELVNHLRLGISNDSPAYVRDAYSYLQDINARYPDTFIYAYYRRADRNNFINLSYYFNPDADGVAKTQNIGWDESEWNIIRVDKHPEKKAYLERITQWAKEWDKKVTLR